MANYVNCEVGTFYETFVEMVEAVVMESEAWMTDEVYAAADDAVETLRNDIGQWSQLEDLPERERLTYERGWRAYKYKMREGHVEAVVANYTAPGLTHLIEFGHELFVFGRDTGRRTQARPHIADAYTLAAAKHFKGE